MGPKSQFGVEPICAQRVHNLCLCNRIENYRPKTKRVPCTIVSELNSTPRITTIQAAEPSPLVR